MACWRAHLLHRGAAVWQLIRVPRPDADALPPDRTMQNLVALVRSRVRAGPVMCANGDGRAAEVDCQICCISMCELCFADAHKRLSLSGPV